MKVRRACEGGCLDGDTLPWAEAQIKSEESSLWLPGLSRVSKERRPSRRSDAGKVLKIVAPARRPGGGPRSTLPVTQNSNPKDPHSLTRTDNSSAFPREGAPVAQAVAVLTFSAGTPMASSPGPIPDGARSAAAIPAPRGEAKSSGMGEGS